LSGIGLPVRLSSRGSIINPQEERLVTKQEFVDQVATKSGLVRRDAAKAVDAVLDSITESLKAGNEVAFTGFGKFTAQHRKERQGVNPRNPTQKVTIPAATVPKFSAGSQLKQAVRSGGAERGM